MNVLHGRGFGTILILLMLLLLPPLSPKTLDTHYLIIIRLIQCMKFENFERNQVWELVNRPPRCKPIRTKWVWKNKEGEKGEVV
jgi:hypothetical protein